MPWKRNKKINVSAHDDQSLRICFTFLHIGKVGCCVTIVMVLQWKSPGNKDCKYIGNTFVHLKIINPYIEYPMQTALYQFKSGSSPWNRLRCLNYVKPELGGSPWPHRITEPLGTNFSKMWIKIQQIRYDSRIDLKISSAKWQPFCLVQCADLAKMFITPWLQLLMTTSNGSWCIGIKGEMSGTVCVTFTWDIYIYELFIAFVCFVVCSLL